MLVCVSEWEVWDNNTYGEESIVDCDDKLDECDDNGYNWWAAMCS